MAKVRDTLKSVSEAPLLIKKNMGTIVVAIIAIARIISTKVKPHCRRLLIFISSFAQFPDWQVSKKQNCLQIFHYYLTLYSVYLYIVYD
jgi:hypothetical protein